MNAERPGSIPTSAVRCRITINVEIPVPDPAPLLVSQFSSYSTSLPSSTNCGLQNDYPGWDPTRSPIIPDHQPGGVPTTATTTTGSHVRACVSRFLTDLAAGRGGANLVLVDDAGAAIGEDSGIQLGSVVHCSCTTSSTSVGGGGIMGAGPDGRGNAANNMPQPAEREPTFNVVTPAQTNQITAAQQPPSSAQQPQPQNIWQDQPTDPSNFYSAVQQNLHPQNSQDPRFIPTQPGLVSWNNLVSLFGASIHKIHCKIMGHTSGTISSPQSYSVPRANFDRLKFYLTIDKTVQNPQVDVHALADWYQPWFHGFCNHEDGQTMLRSNTERNRRPYFLVRCPMRVTVNRFYNLCLYTADPLVSFHLCNQTQ
ncbi:hypothetical protein Pelo_9234 [Pelomyxa schiedti]|nr:hypothetical protein Pelo_9234 [Pelomyxa schiedti]